MKLPKFRLQVTAKWLAHLVVTAAIAGLALLGGISTYRSLTDEIIAHKRTMAMLCATVIRERLNNIKDTAVALSGRPVMVKEVAAGNWDKAIRLLENVLVDFPEFERVNLMSVKGEWMCSVPAQEAPKDRDFSYRDWYKGVSRSWKPYISSLYQRRVGSLLNVISVAVPVKNGDQTVGIMVIQTRPDIYASWIREVAPAKYDTLMVLDQDGNIIYHPFVPRQGPIVQFTDKAGTVHTARDLPPVTVLEYPLLKEKTLAAFRMVEPFGWSAAAFEPVRSAFSVRTKATALAFLPYALVAFAVNFLIVWLFRLGQKFDSTRTAFEASEQRYRSLFDSNFDGIGYINARGELREANGVLARLCGYGKPGEDKIIMTVFLPQLQSCMHDLERSPEGIASVEREMVFTRADGVIVPVEVRLWRDAEIEHGSEQGWWCIIRDISRRKEQESRQQQDRTQLEALVEERLHEVRASEERFRLLTAMSPAGIFLTGAQAQCTYVNPRLLQMGGVSEEQLRAQGWAACVHSAQRVQVESAWGEALRTQRRFEYECMIGSGAIETARWVYIIAVPLRLPAEEGMGYLGLVTDVSERRSYEDELRSSRERLRAIFEGVRESVVIVSFESGKIEEANMQMYALIGYQRGELESMPWARVHPSSAAPWCMSWLDQVRRSGGSESVPAQIITRDGRQVPVEAAARVIMVQGERAVALIMYRDITERVQFEQSLQEKIADLERLNRIAVDREIRMVELKEKIEHLQRGLGGNQL